MRIELECKRVLHSRFHMVMLALLYIFSAPAFIPISVYFGSSKT